VDGDQIERTLRSWGVTMPIVRDSKNDAQKTFQIVGAPSAFLLGPEGKIHGYKVGLHPDYNDLAAAIDLLLEGQDMAARILADYDAKVRDFESRLAAAGTDPNSLYVEVPRAEIAPASDPQVIRLTKAWQCRDLKEPGNILVVPGPERSPQVFVLDGWRTVAEVDLLGHVVGRHDLALPDRQAATFLRTATDRDGNRYFVASGAVQQQLHLFDGQWQRQWSFPEGTHAGIADVQLADLAGTGQLQVLVGYWDVVGVQGVSLSGDRLWSNRSLQNALQLAVTDANDQGQRHVLCVNSRGTLVPIDYQGQHASDIRVADRAVIHLVAADVSGDGAVELCGLAAQGIDRRVAVGIDAAGSEQWHYEMPQGVHQHQIELIVPVQLPGGDGGWLLPAADGSIHLLTTEGQLVDRFNVGSALAGVALVATADAPLLLVATAGQLTAWHVIVPESP
jgi:hypothetical protein